MTLAPSTFPPVMLKNLHVTRQRKTNIRNGDDIGDENRNPNRRRRKQRKPCSDWFIPFIIIVIITIALITAYVLQYTVFVDTPNESNGGVADVIAIPLEEKDVAFSSVLYSSNNDSVVKSDGDEREPIFQTTIPNAPPCNPLQPSDVTFTLVTQLSFNRLWMMEEHCKRWGNNPISIAVYIGKDVMESHDYDRPYLLKFLVDKYKCHASQFTTEDGGPLGGISLLVSDSSGSRSMEEYPVNLLRNQALSKVRTTHVMYVDADFFESVGLFDGLNASHVKKAFASDDRLALVVPAFQLRRQCTTYKDCPEKNLEKMPRTNKNLKDCIRNKQCNIFDPTNLGGHYTTRYNDWLKQESQTLFPIDCVSSYRYEPYLALRYCDIFPPFQETFTGYGKNKMTWFMQLRRSGYVLNRLSDEYIVHYPHLASPSRNKWNEGPRDIIMMNKAPKNLRGEVEWNKYRRGQVDRLFFKVQKLAGRIYQY